jgi:hypothetical protein
MAIDHHHRGEKQMPSIEPHIHKGDFAAGQTADEHAHEGHGGSFAEGEATPQNFANEDSVGSFAEGEAMPQTYAGEDRVGSFGASAARRSADMSDTDEP